MKKLIVPPFAAALVSLAAASPPAQIGVRATSRPAVPPIGPPRALPISGAPEIDFPEVDWVVYDMELVGDRLLLGGNFQRVGRGVGALIDLDGATFERRSAGPRIEGIVADVIPDGTGGTIVCGSLEVEGLGARGLVRVAPDGAISPFSSSVVAGARALAVDAATGVLYVAGSIREVAGQPRNLAAAFDLQTGALLPWNPGINAPTPQSFATEVLVAAGRVWLGGNRVHEAGAGVRRYLVACDAVTGALDPHDFDLGVIVTALATDGTRVFVAGDFQSVSGVQRERFAAFDAQTYALDGLDLPCDRAPRALHVDGPDLFLGGGFSVIAGLARSSAARVDLATGVVSSWSVPLAFGVPSSPRSVEDIDVGGSQVALAGSFVVGGGQDAVNLAVVDRASGALQGPGKRYTVEGTSQGSVEAVQFVGGRLVAGGDIFFEDAVESRHLAAVDMVSRSVDESWVAAKPNGTVQEIVVNSRSAYFIGGFTGVGGAPRPGLAAVDLATGALETQFVPDLSGFSQNGVAELAASETTLFVSFYDATGGPTVIALDARTGQQQPAFGAVTATGPSFSGIRALDVSSNGRVLYVGGNFDRIGPNAAPRDGLAAVDALTGAVLPWAPQGLDGANAIEDRGNAVFAMGYTDVPLFGLRHYSYAYHPVTGALLPWAPRIENATTMSAARLEHGPGRVFLSGHFFGFGGQEAWTAIAVDPEFGDEAGWRPKILGTVYAVQAHDSGIVATGNFQGADGRQRHSLVFYPYAR